MAGRVSVSCPGCLAKLNLPDASKLGKKIKCPKCSDVFVAEANEDEDMDDLEMDEEEARPRASGGRKRGGGGGSSSGGRGKKAGGKKGKSSAGNSGPMIAIGAVAVVALIGVGLFASGVFSRAPQPIAAQPSADAMPMPTTTAPVSAHGPAMAAHGAPPANPNTPMAPPASTPTPAAPSPAVNLSERYLGLRWMPAETEVIVHLKVAELWKSPLLKDITENFITALILGQLQERTGLVPADIESVTLGVADTKAVQAAGISRAMGLPMTPALPKAVAVVRTTKPISLEQILKSSPELKAGEHGTQKFFEVVAASDEKNPQPFGGWLAEPNTLIVTSTADLKAIIDRKEIATPRNELQIVDPASHMIVVVAPKDPKAFTQDAPIPPAPPGMPPELQAMVTALRESTRSVGVGINLRGGFDVQVAVQMADTNSAAQVKTGVDVGIAQGREQFAPMKAMPLGGLGDQLLSGLKVESKDQVIKVSTGLPDSAQKDIELALQMASTLFTSKPAARTMASQPQDEGDIRARVSPEEFDGLPEGLSIIAGCNLTRSIHTSKTLLDLVVELEGELPAKICGYGQMNLKTITLPNGKALQIDTNEPGLRDVRSKAMFPLSAEDSYIYRMHGSHAYLHQLLEVPRDSAEEIQTVHGSFKLLTYEGSEDFTVKDVAKTAKRPLADPALKAAGVKLIPTFRGNAIEELKLSCGDGYFLGTARAIIPDDPNKDDPRFDSDRFSFYPLFEKNRNVQTFMPSTSGNTGANMDIQFTLYRGVKERTVTFKFSGVPLPKFDPEKIAANEKTRRKPGVLTPEEAFTFNYAGPTEPVTAMAEGLVDGTTVTSRLAWGRGGDPAAPDGRKLKVLLQLQGEGMKGICGYGNLEMQPLTLDEGSSLTIDKKEDRSFLPHSATGPTIKPFTFSEQWGTNPPGTLLVLVPYDYPPKAALNVREMQGTIKLLTFDSAKEITINDAPVKAKQPLADPELIAAGIKLSSSKVHDKFELLTLTHGKDFFVSIPMVSFPGDPDPDGRKQGFFLSTQEDKASLQISSAIRDQAAKFPTNMRIHFTLYSGLKERTVSFKFADVPLPDRNAPFSPYPGTQ